MVQRLLAGLMIINLVAGCAVGNKIDYSGAPPQIDYRGNGTVAVTAHDQRFYVISRDKQPDFVGLQRGGFGNPFNISTASGNSLAEDMVDAISQSLSKQGFSPLPIITDYAASQERVMRSLKATNADRLMLLKINEWKSDTYTNTALIYNLDFIVMDSEGIQLITKHLAGRDDLRGSVMNPPGYAKKAVPIAFRQKLESLLNDGEVAAALVSNNIR